MIKSTTVQISITHHQYEFDLHRNTKIIDGCSKNVSARNVDKIDKLEMERIHNTCEHPINILVNTSKRESEVCQFL